MPLIHVEEPALNRLKQALGEAGENYKENLAKLIILIDQITSGDIQGDPATDLLNKFKNKEFGLREIARIIDEAEEYTGMQTTSFSAKIDELHSEMK